MFAWDDAEHAFQEYGDSNDGIARPLVRLEPVGISASADINSLQQKRPEAPRDPRTADKLVDGCNNTRRGRHMWLVSCLFSVW